jgi:hypothetical protein
VSVDGRCEKIDGMQSWHCPNCRRLVLCIVPVPGTIVQLHCDRCPYRTILKVPVDNTNPQAPIMRQST